jgi:hypothetical protein
MDRRVVIAGIAALSVGIVNESSGQEIQKIDMQSLIRSMAENLRNIAKSNALHNLYANLAYLQIQLRIDENFNGYEAGELFSKGANSTISETLFSRDSRSRLAEVGLNIDTVGDRFQKMGEIFETQKDSYDKFLQLISSSASELGSAAPPQDAFARAILYFAISLLALNPTRFDEATEESWIWPFCSKRE